MKTIKELKNIKPKIGIIEKVQTLFTDDKFYHAIIYKSNEYNNSVFLLSEHTLISLINEGYQVNIVTIVSSQSGPCVLEKAQCHVYDETSLRSNPDENFLNNLNQIPATTAYSCDEKEFLSTEEEHKKQANELLDYYHKN